MTANPSKTPYDSLSPETVLAAVESVGLACDGHQLALNSYENRVYQVGLEGGGFVVVKFYRAGRWTDAAILEEHRFCARLAEEEIPVEPPLVLGDATLHHWAGFRFAVYARRGGRAPDLENLDHLEWLGRLLARIHAVGVLEPFRHRPTLDMAAFGDQSRSFLLQSGFIPRDLEEAYATLTRDLLGGVRACWQRAGGEIPVIRLHGDCHAGNILWSDDGPHFVDFDDARMGPPVQDLWMCLSGDRAERSAQLATLLEGYEMFQSFDLRQLVLIEALRTLRMMHHAAWIARRWDDPAFPRAFPWFNAPRYWEEHILALREQAAALDEAPLALMPGR
ncbi:MAG: serine/threonine protein kinase [Magnetococcales bacterium]|nr:serine/threonine protein kinase [Magnetococcales bacterium]